MQNPKEKYVRSTLTAGLKDATKLKIERWPNHQIDLEKCIQLPPWEFLEVAFQVALLRNISVEEKKIFNGYIQRGATNAALAFIILSSDEIPPDINKLNVKKYKEAYDQFESPKSFKNNKLTRWLRKALAMPARSFEFYQHTSGKLLEISTNMETLKNMYENLVRDTNQNFEMLSHKLNDSFSIMQQKMEQCKTIVPGFTGGNVVVQIGDGLIMAVPSEEWRLAMYLNLHGFFEFGSEQLFKSVLKPGMNVVDVGANFGTYSLHAMKAGCTTYSFEPSPRAFEVLAENMIINEFEGTNKYFLYNNAVADKEQDLEFSVGAISGHNSLCRQEAEKTDTITVHFVALDDVLKDVPEINVIKIDAKGTEPLVFKGMKSIITNNRQIKILMKFAPGLIRRKGADPAQFIEEIKSYGFIFREIQESGMLRFIDDEAVLNSFSVNLFLEKNAG